MSETVNSYMAKIWKFIFLGSFGALCNMYLLQTIFVRQGISQTTTTLIANKRPTCGMSSDVKMVVCKHAMLCVVRKTLSQNKVI